LFERVFVRTRWARVFGVPACVPAETERAGTGDMVHGEGPGQCSRRAPCDRVGCRRIMWTGPEREKRVPAMIVELLAKATRRQQPAD